MVEMSASITLNPIIPGNGQIGLSWTSSNITSSNGLVYYYVYYSQQSLDNYTESTISSSEIMGVATMIGPIFNNLSTLITGLTNATNYNFRIYAEWSIGDYNLLRTISNTVSGFASQYIVTYNSEGGTAIPGSPFAVASSGQNHVVQDAPIKDGYTFGGWSNGETTYQPGDSFIITGEITLTALWTPIGTDGVVCFLGNSPVLTPSGYKRIDSLAVGDMVRTADGRDVAIQRVKHQRVLSPSSAVNPFVIPTGQFGATQNLAISPRHAVAVPGRGMVEAHELGLRQLSMKAAFDYYNLELPEWDNMVVAGVEVESLAPKKRVVMTAAQFRELVGGRSIDLARLARIATVRADGSVDVTLTRKARRIV